LLASYSAKLTLCCLLVGLIIFTLGFLATFHPHSVYGSSGHHKHSSRGDTQKNTQSSPSIAICCGWDDKIANGQLTYSITGGSPSSRQAVTEAMTEWQSRIDGLQLKQISNVHNSDIMITFQTEGGQTSSHSDGIGSIAGRGHFFSEILGETRLTPKDGLIDKAQITLARMGFGSPIDASETTQIALHEIGHALGLGHANFAGDIMAPAINYQSNLISKCDISAVQTANNWETRGSSTPAQPPSTNRIGCS
jgi:predicted Zn-dependent protease